LSKIAFTFFHLLVAISPQHCISSEIDRFAPEQKKVVQTLKLEGHYSFDQFHPQVTAGRLETSLVGSFVMAIQSSNLWMIRYTNESAATNLSALYSSYIAICDATNIYVIRFVNPTAIPGNVVRWEGSFYHGCLPNPEDQHIYNIWFTFMLSPVAATQGHGILNRPIGDLSLYFHPSNSCAFYVLTNHTNPLELEIVLEQGPHFLNRNPKKKGRLEHASLPPPYQNGYTFGRGRWQGTLPLMSALLPAHYEFTIYSPKDHGLTKDDLLEYQRWNCFVTNARVEEISRLDLRAAEVNGFIMVADHRFAGEGYAVLNYGLPDLNYTTINQHAYNMRRVTPPKTLEHWVMERAGFRSRTAQTRLDTLFRALLYFIIASPFIAFSVSKAIKTIHKRKGVHI